MLLKFLTELASALVFPAIFWLGMTIYLWDMKQTRKKKEEARKEELRREKIQQEIEREKYPRSGSVEYI